MIDPALAIAAPFITGFEGFSAEPYEDVGGIWTIGFGNTHLADGSAVTAKTPPITREAATALFQRIVEPDMAIVRECVTVPISNNAAAALCSFVYNCGMHAFQTSTMLRLLNEGAAPDVWIAQLALWDRARGKLIPGLVRRRTAEADLARTADTSCAKPS